MKTPIVAASPQGHRGEKGPAAETDRRNLDRNRGGETWDSDLVILFLLAFYVGNGWVAGGCWDDY